MSQEYFGLTPDSVLHGSGGGSSAPGGVGVGVGGAPKDSTTRTAALKSDSDELKNMMVDLFRGLEHDLREVSVNGSKMDHFYTLEMLVQCEKIMQESSAAAAAAAAASAAAANAAAASSAAAAAASAAANSSGAGSPSSTSSSISLGFTPLPTPSSSASASSSAAAPGSTPPGSEYLISIVTALSTHLKLSFNQFVDGEIEWLNALKPNPKRCGILQPFAKFPALVNRMENVVRSGAGAAAALSPTSKSGSASSATAAATAAAAAAASQARSQAADTSYQKLASALFRWLDGVAKSDDKYTDVVVMENAHHYHTMFSSPFLSVPALEQSVAKAGAAYKEHMARYVAWNIAYEMPAVTKFWARIEDQLKSILPEEIPFASELSKVRLGSSMAREREGRGREGGKREHCARCAPSRADRLTWVFFRSHCWWCCSVLFSLSFSARSARSEQGTTVGQASECIMSLRAVKPAPLASVLRFSLLTIPSSDFAVRFSLLVQLQKSLSNVLKRVEKHMPKNVRVLRLRGWRGVACGVAWRAPRALCTDARHRAWLRWRLRPLSRLTPFLRFSRCVALSLPARRPP